MAHGYAESYKARCGATQPLRLLEASSAKVQARSRNCSCYFNGIRLPAGCRAADAFSDLRTRAGCSSSVRISSSAERTRPTFTSDSSSLLSNFSATKPAWRSRSQQLVVAAPRRPKPSRDSAARSSLPPLSKTQRQGLIIIRADAGWPTAYPGPGSSVTTTLYD